MKRGQSERAMMRSFWSVFITLLAVPLVGEFNAVRAGEPEHRTVFVAPRGNDSWPGTSKRPWKTLERAARSVKPGYTVRVAKGVYTASVPITTLASGTPNARISFISDQKWGAKLSTTSRGYTFVWLNKGDYVDIEGFDISCAACSIGIRNYASNVRMIGNHVHDIPGEPGCTGNGGAGINNGNYSAADNDIIGNVVHDIGPKPTGSCNRIHGIYHSNLRGHIWNNIVYNNSGWGIATWHAANAENIVNNTIFANGGFNGTAYVGGGIVIGAGDDPGGIYNDNAIVANNIIYKNGGIGLREYGRAGARNRYQNNLIFANGLDTMFLKGHGAESTVKADPKFIRYTGDFFSGDYRLKATSPALKAGKRELAPLEDFEGRLRSRQGLVDLGAYERSVGATE